MSKRKQRILLIICTVLAVLAIAWAGNLCYNRYYAHARGTTLWNGEHEENNLFVFHSRCAYYYVLAVNDEELVHPKYSRWTGTWNATFAVRIDPDTGKARLLLPGDELWNEYRCDRYFRAITGIPVAANGSGIVTPSGSPNFHPTRNYEHGFSIRCYAPYYLVVPPGSNTSQLKKVEPADLGWLHRLSRVKRVSDLQGGKPVD